MERQQPSRSRPIRRFLWAGATVLLTIAILIGYHYEITLWDWIKLLVVPAVIAAGGLWFSVQQREREQRIANERAQDEALQGYLDGMSELLTDKEQPLHRAQTGDSLSTVARARTLTVLGRLDGGRKRSVLQFLFESGLINKEQVFLDESDLIKRHHNIVSLKQADLGRAELSETELGRADMREANLQHANLIKAYLGGADLRAANLREANLDEALLYAANMREANLNWVRLSQATLLGADLSRADLFSANLSVAHLSMADLWETRLEEARLYAADLNGANLERANLKGANLERASLNMAVLSRADLEGANLRRADLSGADMREAKGWTEEQLSTACSLEGATMPDGKKYEDWPKSKNRKGDG